MAVVYTKKDKHNIIIRFVLLGIVLIAVVIAIVLLINSFKIKEGYNEITNTYVNNLAISNEFNLKYYLKKDNNSLQENKDKLERLYAESLDDIYELIDSKEDHDDIYNIYYINNHPNEEIQIDETLYDVLKNIYESDSRFLLYGPLYQYWDMLYYLGDSYQKDKLDPSVNDEYKEKLENFVSSSINEVSLDFYSNNTIKLNVSDNYNAILSDDYIEYIGLGYLTNMIIMDYIKKQFVLNDYKDGYIISKDGYLLHFGGEHISTFPLVTDLYTTGYATLEINSGNAYISAYNYYVNDSYRYYKTTYNEESVVRNQYINNDTGYQYELDNSIYYKSGYLFDTYLDLINYINGDTNQLSYAIFNNSYDNPKCITNIKSDITFKKGIEVIYE